MHRAKHSARSPSTSSSDRAPARSSAKSPPSSDYEYVGRLVTRERAVNRKPKSVEQHWSHRANTQKYHHSTSSRRTDGYEQAQVGSGLDEDDDGLSQPLGVIRINDRHFREIYRLPTPPPKVKRIYHRLRSPEPKIIERVYVRRPAPQIIENVIEVPPEKVKIIHREKYLENSKPITRSKLVRLQAREEEDPPSTTYVSAGPRPTATATSTITPASDPNAQPGASTALVYPPQPNLRTVGYFQSDIPPHIMLQSQQPLQVPSQTNFQPAAASTLPAGYQYLPQTHMPTAAASAVPAGYQYVAQPNMSTAAPGMSTGFQYQTQQPQTVPSGLFGYQQY